MNPIDLPQPSAKPKPNAAGRRPRRRQDALSGGASQFDLYSGPEFGNELDSGLGAPPPKSAADGTALMTAARQDSDWARADAAVKRLADAVIFGVDQERVREALDLGAAELAKYASNGAADDLPALTTKWRRSLRLIVNADGSSLDKAELIRLRGDLAALHVKKAELLETAGVIFSQSSDNDTILKTTSGERLVEVPRYTSEHIKSRPQKFARQLHLLRRAHEGGDEDELFAQALAVFSHLHEKQHDVGDARILYKATEERARAFVSNVMALRAAKTKENREHAEAMLQATLFAEALPARRLASLALDIFTPVGRANALEDLDEDSAAAVKAFREGRFTDGAISTLWTLIDGVAIVGGVNFKKLMIQAGHSTPQTRRIIAARDLARMQAQGRKRLPGVSAEAILGKALWARFDKESQDFLSGVFNNAKGIASEEQMRQLMVDVGAKPKRGPGLDEADGREITRVDILPEHGGGSGKDKLGPRYYDEILEETRLRPVLGLFLLPASTPGVKTRVELKVDGARSRGQQAKKDAIIAKNLEKYDTNELLLLRIPYNDISKGKVHQEVMRLMQSDTSMAAKYIRGHNKYKIENGERVLVERIKWPPEKLEKMIQDVDRALRKQAVGDASPTVGLFVAGLAAKMADESERMAEGER